ncbi:MAG: hypothetical protein DBX55_09045 [Verrucomicrobia bacterium]|nr:MAG: hypothetical protein DBX55_09045 [Verrucomicrobiota bacterium]
MLESRRKVKFDAGRTTPPIKEAGSPRIFAQKANPKPAKFCRLAAPKNCAAQISQNEIRTSGNKNKYPPEKTPLTAASLRPAGGSARQPDCKQKTPQPSRRRRNFHGRDKI